LISRVLPFVRSFISVPAGIAEMNRLRFDVLTTHRLGRVGGAARRPRLRRRFELEARQSLTSTTPSTADHRGGRAAAGGRGALAPVAHGAPPQRR
jgi:hypothetical protein